MYNIPNMYIQLKELAQTSAEIPEIEERVGDLEDQVEDLDVQINGDSTAEPPVPGIVDELEAIETTLYGDETADPPVEGLTDRVDDLELTINGDSTAQPPVAGLTDRVEDLEGFHDGEVIATVTADGSATYGAIFDALYGQLSPTENSANLRIQYSGVQLRGAISPSRYSVQYEAEGSILILGATLRASGSTYRQVTITSGGVVSNTDISTIIPVNGTVISIVKY